MASGAEYEPPPLPAKAPTSTAQVSVAVCAFGEGGEQASASAARIAPLLTLAFNGSGEGGVEDGEPMLRWLMQPLGGPRDPRRPFPKFLIGRQIVEKIEEFEISE